MATLFIFIIYLAFISLGLPDTLLGSAWPVMQIEFGMPLDAEGLITMIVCLATIFFLPGKRMAGAKIGNSVYYTVYRLGG